MDRDDVAVGFVGLGIMGGRMAANLQKAGYKLVVHDLQRQAAIAGQTRLRGARRCKRTRA